MDLTALIPLLLAPVLVAVGWLAGSHALFVLWHRRAGIRLRPLASHEHVLVYLRELVAFAQVAAWHLRAMFVSDLHLPAGEIRGRPVLLIHGFTQNGTNWWGLRRRLAAEGRPTVTVHLGRPLRSVSRHAVRLADRLRDLRERFPDGVDVVAHSMGGVVLRYVLAQQPELAPTIYNVVTLGTPHRGTAGARHAPRGWAVDISELALGSCFLATLPSFATVAPHARVTTIAGERDFVVYPSTSCHLADTRQIELSGIGHAGLLTHAAAHAAVTEALAGRADRRAAK